jgi:hypothetical protein
VFHVIYRTTDPVTGRYYLGKHTTRDLNDGYQGSGRWVSQSKRNGVALVTTIVATFTTEQEALDEERRLVTAETLLDPLCMNLTRGGRGSFHHLVGVPRDEATKARVSEKLRAMFAAMDDDERRASRSRFHGQKRPDHSARMSGQGNSFAGRKHTEEAKARIRAGRTTESRREKARGNTNTLGRRWFNDGSNSWLLTTEEGERRGLTIGRLGGWTWAKKTNSSDL